MDEPRTHGRTCPCSTCQAELAENTPHESGLTCIHVEIGLCPSCREEYAVDPLAWIEYGEHQQGILNWQSLKQEFLDEAATQDPMLPDAWDGIPF